MSYPLKLGPVGRGRCKTAAGVLAALAALSLGGCYSGLEGFGRTGSGADGDDDDDDDDDVGEGETDDGPGSDEPDPGRVTMRRLNSVEYDNTIRDLFFGLEVSPADGFPADEVSLGFDNIADVLSVTPVLFELYERAAEQTIATALVTTGGGGEAVHHEAEDLGGSVGAACCGGFWNLSSNGEISTTVDLAQDGDYAVVVRAYGQQAGPDPARMSITVDGTLVTELDVTAISDAPGEYTAELPLTAGAHSVSVGFTNDFYDPDVGADRNLLVDWVDVVGPQGVGGTTSVRDLVLTCEPAAGAESACADEILRTFGRRAWRRPLADAEVERLVLVVDSALAEGLDWEGAISVGLKALLVSPHFLFRVEVDPDPGALTPHPLTDYELATRLSYLMWSTMPDDELFGLADAGMLQDPVVLEGQVRRMLEDERAEALVDNFAGQWLYLRNLDYEIAKDYDTFPEFNLELQQSMKTETEMFFRTFITEGRSLRELLTAEDTFVDTRLAEHYELPAPAGEGFERISLEGHPRRGLLTHAGLLSVLAHPVTTSPVKRGEWVLDHLMCQSPPPPPPGVEVPPLEPSVGGTMREQLAQHRADPNCAVCHDLMDPIGLGLEHYDAIGRHRLSEAGMDIDASGELPGGGAFNDGLEMVGLIAEGEDFPRCTIRQTMTYALGRPPTTEDQPYIDDIEAETIARDFTLEGLLVALVTNDVFRQRRGEAQ